jgi:hypothetical protein
MKKAKIILTAIAVFAVVGGALAFKTSRFTELPLWTLNGSTTTTTTTAVGGPTYTALVPFCTTTPFFGTTTFPGAVLVNARVSAAAQVIGTRVGGTETTLIVYRACPAFQTFTTIID